MVTSRSRAEIRFPDLSERRALKLAAVMNYTALTHFRAWHRRMGAPDLWPHGILTPLVYVELETTDLPVDFRDPVQVRGRTYLARATDDAGETTHILRFGEHEIFAGAALGTAGSKRRAGEEAGPRQTGESRIAGAKLLNVFTRSDPDPRRRKVLRLPPELGWGEVPSRILPFPRLEEHLPPGPPAATDAARGYWHYGQTDPNGHVTATEYLRLMESFAYELLGERGYDPRRWYARRARCFFRKPCFRGESYRRSGWFFDGPEPKVVGVFSKGEDPGTKPAVLVEIVFARHDEARPS
ncbi:MAG: hypothetical protein KatS3mg076_1860 [Candidatus Binatia bacterium]|nr:MAG: hypothetical protein KatS3mg076_1860 [Candidatus Binatia bacterium]